MRTALAVIAAAGMALSAATMDEFQRDCSAFRKHPSFATVRGCAADLFTLQPVHPIVRNIVPGGGTGVGLNLRLDSPRGQWHRVFQTTGAISLRDFWVAESSFSMIHPKFGEWNTARDSFLFSTYVRARGLPRMPFYGLGPDTSRANLVDFSENEAFIGMRAINPLSSWFGVGGTFEGILPEIGGISSTSVRSIDRYFNEATAPGLLTQPNFTHAEVFLHPHHADPFEFDYRIGYNFFHDTDTGHYSFRRFRADLRHNIYPERSGGQPHRDSVLSIRAVLSTSQASAGNAIPFYLQETIGGNDINGDPTLRGFADYRFRGPNLILFQTQYERRIWKAFGILAFYDTGKVTMRRSDLDFSNYRHSYGFGGNFWVGAKVVFRAYVGLGSGEGTHPFFGIPAGL